MPTTPLRASRKLAKESAEILKSTKKDRIGVYLNLDRNIVDWFKQNGSGYQLRINEVLRRFVVAVESEDSDLSSILENAQELFEKYYAQCFWYMKKDLIVTDSNLCSVIKGLKLHGGREGYIAASKLCP